MQKGYFEPLKYVVSEWIDGRNGKGDEGGIGQEGGIVGEYVEMPLSNQNLCLQLDFGTKPSLKFLYLKKLDRDEELLQQISFYVVGFMRIRKRNEWNNSDGKFFSEQAHWVHWE
ncbi:hypothetical protein M0802_008834 [Mischocyttarus mexicanus]|nr:hypothetical protein M0802_008834 [Mischocyttarus mexicanus]